MKFDQKVLRKWNESFYSLSNLQYYATVLWIKSVKFLLFGGNFKVKCSVQNMPYLSQLCL